MEKKNNLLSKFRTNYIIAMGVIILFMLIAPSINYEIFARTESVLPKQAAGANVKLPDYLIASNELNNKITENFKNITMPKTDEETTAEDNKEETPIEARKLSDFLWNRGFYHEESIKTGERLAAGTDTFYEEDFRAPKGLGIFCSAKGIYIQTTPQESLGAYIGRFKDNVQQKIVDNIDNMIEENGIDGSVGNDIELYKHNIAYKASGVEMIFKPSEKGRGQFIQAFNKLQKEIGLNFKFDEKSGNIALEEKEYKRLMDVFANNDVHWSITSLMPPDTKEKLANKQAWVPKRKDFDANVQVDDYLSDNLIHQHTENLRKKGKKVGDGHNTFQMLSRIVYKLEGRKTGIVTDDKLLERFPQNAHFQRYPDELINSPKASPVGIYVLSNERILKRDADEANRGFTEADSNQISLHASDNSFRSRSLQIAYWHSPEGIYGPYLLGIDYRTILNPESDNYVMSKYLMSPFKQQIDGLVSDSDKFADYWKRFIKYLRDHKDDELPKTHKIRYIRYANGKPEGGDGSPTTTPDGLDVSDVTGVSNKTVHFDHPTEIKYVPHFTKDAEEQKPAYFNQATNEWIIGPYKVEYFKDQIKDISIAPARAKTKNFATADIVGAHLEGKYRRFKDGKDDGQGASLMENPHNKLKENGAQSMEQIINTNNALNDMTKVLIETKDIFKEYGIAESYNNFLDRVNSLKRKIDRGQKFTREDLATLAADKNNLLDTIERLKKIIENDSTISRKQKNEKIQKLNEGANKIKKAFDSLVEQYRGISVESNEKRRKLVDTLNNRFQMTLREAVSQMMLDLTKFDSLITNEIKNSERYKKANAENRKKLDEWIYSLQDKNQKTLEKFKGMAGEILAGAEVSRKRRQSFDIEIHSYMDLIRKAEKYDIIPNIDMKDKIGEYIFEKWANKERKNGTLTFSEALRKDKKHLDRLLEFYGIADDLKENEDPNEYYQREILSKENSWKPHVETGSAIQDYLNDGKKDENLTGRPKVDDTIATDIEYDANNEEETKNKNQKENVKDDGELAKAWEILAKNEPDLTNQFFGPAISHGFEYFNKDIRNPKKTGILNDLMLLHNDAKILKELGYNHIPIEKLQELNKHISADQVETQDIYAHTEEQEKAETVKKSLEKYENILNKASSLGVPVSPSYKENAKNAKVGALLYGSAKTFKEELIEERKWLYSEFTPPVYSSMPELTTKTSNKLNQAKQELEHCKTRIRSLESQMPGLQAACDFAMQQYLNATTPEEQAAAAAAYARASTAYRNAMTNLSSSQARAGQLEVQVTELTGLLTEMNTSFPEIKSNMQSFTSAEKLKDNKYVTEYIKNLNSVFLGIAAELKKDLDTVIAKVNENIEKERREKLLAQVNNLYGDIDSIDSQLKIISVSGKKLDLNQNPNQGQNQNQQNQQNQNNSNNKETEVKEIKSWRFLIPEKEKNNQKYEKGKEYYPESNQEFYYVIKHDPQLMEIVSASFDFGYMVYNADIEYYTGHMLSFDGVVGQVETNRKEITDGNFKTVDLTTNTNLPKVQANARKLKSQALSRPQVGIWLQLLRVEISPTLKPVLEARPIDPEEIEPKVPEQQPPGNPMAKLYVPIAGQVFLDKIQGDKKLLRNDFLDAKDVKLEDVKVGIYRVIVKTDPNTGIITDVYKREKARIFEPKTFKKINGDEIYTNSEGMWGKYVVHDVGLSEEEAQNYPESKVTFEVTYGYDGVVFETVYPFIKEKTKVSPNTNVEQLLKDYLKDPIAYKNSSKVAEFPALRDEYNKKFAEIEGGKPFDKEAGSSIETDGDHANTVDRSKSTKLEYESEDGSEFYVSKLKSYTGKEMDENGKENIPEEEKFKFNRMMSASTLNLNVPIPIYDKYFIPIDVIEDNKVSDLADIKTDDLIWYNAEKLNFKSTESYMYQFNCGLREREKVDVEATKDLISATITINKKAQTYIFDESFDYTGQDQNSGNDFVKKRDDEGNILDIDLNKLSANVRQKTRQEYVLDLYKADYLYRTAMYSTTMMDEANIGGNVGSKDFIETVFEDGYKGYANAIYSQIKSEMAEEKKQDENGLDDTRQLDVFLMYKVTVINASEIDNVAITELRDQYNKEYMEEVQKDIIKYIQLNPEMGKNAYQTDVAPQSKELKIYKPKVTEPPIDIFEVADMQKTKTAVWGGQPGKRAYPSKKAAQSLNVQNDEIINSGLFLKAGEKAEIYTTYRLKREKMYKNAVPNSLNVLNDDFTSAIVGNIAEVGSYAVYSPLTGKVLGKVDKDSAPGNVDLDMSRNDIDIKNLDFKAHKIENDTGIAPGLKISVTEGSGDKTNSREISGYVFEDGRTDEIEIEGGTGAKTPKIKVGDGKFDEAAGEKKVPNQKIVLEERISIKSDSEIGKKITKAIYGNSNPPTDTYIDIPFVWPNVVNTGAGTIDVKGELGLEASARSSDTGDYNFKGVPAGNYVVKIPYTGRVYENEEELKNKTLKKSDLAPTAYQENRSIKWINGIDFKSTMYRNNGNDGNLNETWIPKVREDGGNKETNLSYIRDDEYRRVEITKNLNKIDNPLADALEIMNSVNFGTDGVDEKNLETVHKFGRMVATTPKICFTVENLEKLTPYDDNKIKNLESIFENSTLLKGSVEGGTSGGIQNYPELNKVEYLNAGLTQRPISKMELRKDIKRITLDTNSGKRLIDLRFNVKPKIKNGKAEDVEILELYQNKKPEASIIEKLKLYENPTDKILFDKELDKENSIGYDKVNIYNSLIGLDQSLLKKGVENVNSNEVDQGFMYINLDEQLMQGSTLKTEYVIRAVNLSEPDIIYESIDKILASNSGINEKFTAYYTGRIINGTSKKLMHEEDQKYEYGHIMSTTYYKPLKRKLKLEEIDTLKFDEIMDVIDNNSSYDKDAFKGKDESPDAAWNPAKKIDLVNKIKGYKTSEQNKMEEVAKSINLLDDYDVPYITENRSNIYISSKKAEEKYPMVIAKQIDDIAKAIDEYYIGTQRYISSASSSKNTAFENTAELLKYSVKSGKRLRGSVPGTIFSEERATEEEKKNVETIHKNNRGTKMFARSMFEKDAFTTEIITITPPTGVKLKDKQNLRKNVIIGTIGFIVVLAGVLLGGNAKKKKQDNKVSNKKSS